MRIVQRETGREAATVDDLYQCFPASESNRGKSVRFSSVERAAAFLCENPDWGILMEPGAEVVYRDIVIERDA
ncbi:MAG: hypothetical protein KF914_17005 [Rhizobiaceae bacterium]|nr:hypothetical protein [Rhizobiaceae bacterium]